MDRQRFEQLTQEALESLPEELSRKIENVVLVVEDYPRPEMSAKMGKGGFLLGLYEGVPLSRRGTHYGAYAVTPDKISLYQKNIERVAHGEAEIAAKIREVLIHEIAHHFGMNEQEIRDAGY
jgi:predicted Zn-dependent protease with MMP-like domain